MPKLVGLQADLGSPSQFRLLPLPAPTQCCTPETLWQDHAEGQGGMTDTLSLSTKVLTNAKGN